METLELLCEDNGLANNIEELKLGGPELDDYYDYPALSSERKTVFEEYTIDLLIVAIKKMSSLRSLSFRGPIYGPAYEQQIIEAIRSSGMPLESFTLEDRDAPTDCDTLCFPNMRFGSEMKPLREFEWDIGPMNYDDPFENGASSIQL